VFLDCSPNVLGIPLKTCSKCGETKPLDEFNKNRNAKDGRNSYCKICHRSEAIRYERELRVKDPDRVREKHKKYEDSHQEEIREYQRQRYVKNKAEINARNSDWYYANRDKRLASIREYKKTPDGKSVRVRSEHKRRSLEAGSNGSFTAVDIEAIRIGQTDKRGRVRCWWCRNPMSEWHIDHRIPLARGGSNYPNNLCLACPRCNMSKQGKTPQEWAGRLL
jgi:5-methylcytosine-specific restriction endonuclease McrA